VKRVFILALVVAWPISTWAQDFSGNLAAEAITFPNPAKFPDQLSDDLSLSFQPRLVGDWNEGNDNWSVELFMRGGSKDDNRNHADIRELLWLHLSGDNEWRVGINTMFWGVTETRHLVDVVNQIDLLEGIDGEAKLGQQMIHLKHYEDWGVLDFLVLPGFREREYPGINGRPRLPLLVDNSQTIYESSDGKHHIDYAFRFSQTYNALDLGLSVFKGTDRQPELIPGLSTGGQSVLIPVYLQMTQYSIDAQLTTEDWLWKLEAIHRDTKTRSYQAFTGGFEYTFYSIFDSDINLGSLVEYSYNGPEAPLRDIFDHDLFLGARLAFNDAESSELLAGYVIDTEKGSQTFRLEASRRFGDSWKGTLEMQLFPYIADDDPLLVFEDDDYLLLELARFF
jgi:hypothetical protein